MHASVAPVLISVLIECSRIKRRVFADQLSEILEGADAGERAEITPQNEEYVRRLVSHHLFGEPLRIVLLHDTALIPHLHAGVLILETPDRVIDDPVGVAALDSPVTVRENAYRQDLFP